jgi:uncharacterized protein
MKNIKFLVVGMLLGIVFIKAEMINWFRIQEMFQLTSWNMYKIMCTAVIIGASSVFIIKKFNIKTFSGQPITITNKKLTWGQPIGGVIFGIGWAITGACPGPLFAQIGNGFGVVCITFFSALAGTWVYGLLQKKLPQ